MADLNPPVRLRNKQYLIDLSIISVVGLLIFYKSLDIYFLGENISHIQAAWSNLTNTDYYYLRPVAVFTFILDQLVWGMNPTGYHLTNLIFHLLNSILVYSLAGRIFDNRFISLSSALLFLLHPIHSTDIFWISGRTDMVCSIFYLLSLISFIDYYKSGVKKQLVYSIIHFTLALFAKEMAISLPLIITLYLFVDSQATFKQKFIYALRKSGAFYLCVFLFFAIKFILQADVLENVVHSNLDPVHLTKNIAGYLGLLIIPGGHIEIAGFLKTYPLFFFISSAATLILLVLAIRLWWTEKFLIFSILFILITILPVSRLLMRWYLYIPSIGFVLALSFLISKMGIPRLKMKYISSMLLLLVLLIYTPFLIFEQMRWVHAGQLAEKISTDIAQTIKTYDLHNLQVLNLPTELEETPVLGYGFEEHMRYRLRHDFDHQRDVKIDVAAHVSLARESDLNRMHVRKISENEYRILINESDSFFIFPLNPAIFSQREKIYSGMVLSDSLKVIQIGDLNTRNEVVSLQVKSLLILDP
jgi:hypothetical protein